MKWLGCCVYSVQLDNTGDRLWSYVSAGVTTASFHYSAPVKLINCKIPPTSFDLVTTSGLPASMMLFQLSYRGCVVFGLVASVKRPKWNNTGNPFRSSDLGVMSPARCLCAMPVKYVCLLRFASLSIWRSASVKLMNWRIPPGGFDPPTSGLWVLRSAAELRGF